MLDGLLKNVAVGVVPNPVDEEYVEIMSVAFKNIFVKVAAGLDVPPLVCHTLIKALNTEAPSNILSKTSQLETSQV